MRYQYRPLGVWTDPVTVDRPPSRFRTPWSGTLELLGYEVEMLGADLIVLQVDVTDEQIRRDGALHVTARIGFPGVRVSFDSMHGPLVYSTDRYADPQDNIHAIALALKALRAVDRYGINRRGEQYRGWLAIEATPAPMTREAAQALLDEYGGWRAAVKVTHPDRAGGNRVAFEQVQEARRVLGI